MKKRTETRVRCYNTLCIPYISIHPSLHALCMTVGRIYREYTECYSISFLFLFFFHQSSLYPIKMFAKFFYSLIVIIAIDDTLKNARMNTTVQLVSFFAGFYFSWISWVNTFLYLLRKQNLILHCAAQYRTMRSKKKHDIFTHEIN